MRSLGWLLLATLLTGIDWSEDLRRCQTGTGVPWVDVRPTCEWADMDGDGDVDQSDFAWFQRHRPMDVPVMVYTFVVPETIRGVSDPEGYVRDLLNARQLVRAGQ